MPAVPVKPVEKLGDRQGTLQQNTIIVQKKAENTPRAKEAAPDIKDAADAMSTAGAATSNERVTTVTGPAIEVSLTRSTYLPGSSKVALTSTRPSLGITGGVQFGAHGEFMFARVSSQGLTCSGSMTTLPAPR